MVDIPEGLMDVLVKAASPIVCGHVRPDSDCLGSMFALAMGLEQATGQAVHCAVPQGSISDRLQFLQEVAKPRIADVACYNDSDLIVVCDTAKAKRTNLPTTLPADFLTSKRVVNIDHHASNTGYGELNWIDPHASSASEMIHRLYADAGWPLTPAVSSVLYAGIHGDTVGFSLPTTSADALAAAADLVQHGADVGEIGERLCRSLSESEFGLRRIIHDNTRLSTTQRIVFSTASHYEMDRAGCSAADIDDQVEIPRALNGPVIALLFTEGETGRIRVNLRSKGDVSVLELAQEIGGGGHHGAAGAIMRGSIEDAVSELVPKAEQFLDRLEKQRCSS